MQLSQKKQPTRTDTRQVLVGVQDAGVREMIIALVDYIGYATTSTNLADWLANVGTPEGPPDVIIIDAWSLHNAYLADQMQIRVDSQSVAPIILTESCQDSIFAERLGAIALPLFFNLDELATAIQAAISRASFPFSNLAAHAMAVVQV